MIVALCFKHCLLDNSSPLPPSSISNHATVTIQQKQVSVAKNLIVGRNHFVYWLEEEVFLECAGMVS